MSGVLYLVATPIGNLSDITKRALEVLGMVNLVVCEDTRVSKKLLAHYSINTPTTSYHHHSPQSVLDSLIRRLQSGESLAYISDAGTPGISDPGGKLVEQAAIASIKVVPIPGASAVTAALSVAGFNTQNYMFLGFPPHKKGRQTFFRELCKSDYVVVIYESTHRIIKTLTELANLLPQNKLVVGRELTKQFETVYRGTASAIIEQLKNSSTKGEFVVIIGKV